MNPIEIDIQKYLVEQVNLLTEQQLRTADMVGQLEKQIQANVDIIHAVLSKLHNLESKIEMMSLTMGSGK